MEKNKEFKSSEKQLKKGLIIGFMLGCLVALSILIYEHNQTPPHLNRPTICTKVHRCDDPINGVSDCYYFDDENKEIGPINCPIRD